MPPDAERPHRVIEQVEGFCELGMWQHAWDLLDDLPDELRVHPDVLSCRLDVLIGLKQWGKALILGKSLVRLMPKDASLWFRLACIQAQLGDMVAAKSAISCCIDIDVGWRLRVVDEPALKGIW